MSDTTAARLQAKAAEWRLRAARADERRHCDATITRRESDKLEESAHISLLCANDFDCMARSLEAETPPAERPVLPPSREDAVVALLAAEDALIRHLWDVAARFKSDDCNAIRELIHAFNKVTRVAILESQSPDIRPDVAAVPPPSGATTEDPAGVCSLCHGPYQFDTSIPSVIWNAVVRAQGLPEFLCLTCIVSIFAKANKSFTAELSGKDFDGLPIEVRVNDVVASDAVEVQAENNRLRHELRDGALAMRALVDVVDAHMMAIPFADETTIGKIAEALLAARALPAPPDLPRQAVVEMGTGAERARLAADLPKRTCPHCQTGENSTEHGGNDRCFHCGLCGYIQCNVWPLPSPPPSQGTTT